MTAFGTSYCCQADLWPDPGTVCHGEGETVLRCVACGKEHLDLGDPWKPVEVVAAVRVVAAQPIPEELR